MKKKLYGFCWLLENRQIILTIFGFFLSTTIFGCTWTTTGVSATWTDPAAWTSSGIGCSGSYPSTTNVNSGDIVVINSTMNLSTSTYQVKTGGTLIVNAPATFNITGGVDLQNGSTFNLGNGATMNVSGNFNNSNNSTGVVVNGTVNVGGDLTSGNGSTVTSSTGTGSFTVQGSISGAGTVFGSSADCSDTSVPCITTAINPLPVEIIFIGLECLNSGTMLKWRTASEHNSDHFAIFRSRDGQSWEKVGVVTAAGNSNQIIEYKFTDPSSNGNLTYYRINQVDIDGAEEVFPILTGDCKINRNRLSVFPNPLNTDAYVRFMSDMNHGSALLLVADLEGNILSKRDVEIIDGSNLFPVSASDLESGMYIVKLIIQGEVQFFTKLIKE